uniref:Ferritin n=1 Tax=Otolemur garnettii TaxID=30611 RepID=H0XLF8_OTOGA
AMAATPSQLGGNYHTICEASVNRQVNLELYAYYAYLSMTSYFDRDDVALKNFTSYFQRQSRKHWEQAKMLMELQNQHGGSIHLRDMRNPGGDDWEDGQQAMECALHLEKNINLNLLDLHHLARNKGDVQLCNFLEKHFLQEQVKTIKELSGYLTNLQRLEALNSSLAEYLFDKLTLGGSDKEN